MIGKTMLRSLYLNKTVYTLLACLLTILLINDYSFAGTTGKIKGKITDKDTGEPIVGANVIIEGTYFGAAADLEGEFYINNIPPGTYTVIASAVGYNKVFVENVSVKIDLSTDLNIQMVSEAVKLGEVVVQAEKPMIINDLTSTSSIVSSEDIKMMPVEGLSQIINLQAGIVDGHFRGGRSNEVAYLVDGIPVNDVYNGNISLRVENNSIRQLEVISGTFNAEYGQALSGVVNIVTQDGSQKFEGSASAYVGNFLTNHTDLFWNLNKINANGPKDVQVSLSGPTKIIDGLTFFASGRYFKSNGVYYGRRYHNVWDTKPIVPDETKSDFSIFNTGDSAFVPMDPEERKSFNTKLTYASETWKISYSLFWDNSWNKYYSHSYRLAPDGLRNHYKTNTMNNFQFSFYPTQDIYLSVKASFNLNEYEGYLYKDEYDARYVEPSLSDPKSSGYTFRHGGNETDRYNRYTKSNLLLFSFDYQINKEHRIKFGVEGRFHVLMNSGKSILWKDTSGTGTIYNVISYTAFGTPQNNGYTRYPYEFAAYIQDKMEYDMMIINAGIRFDYFNSNTTVPADLQNPRQGEDANSNFPGANQKRLAETEYQISPRLGVSFPISDEGAIHFSYGHFFQIPSFENLFVNSNYFIDQGVSSLVGNPELKSMKTVKYEVGIQQILFPNVSADLSIYYSDIRNLLGTKIISIYGEQTRYGIYTNRDYGNSKGIVLTLEKRHSDYFSAKLDYTYQIAQGNGSDPLALFYNSQADPPKEETKILAPLDWDQNSTVNLSVTVGDFTDWSVGFIFSYGSGFPYTPNEAYVYTLPKINTRRKPSTSNFDLKATKSFDIFGFDFNTYLIIYNLFDIKNEYGVSSITGRAGYDLAAKNYEENGFVYGLNTVREFTKNPGDYSRPREVRLGFGVGF
jgi:hypothetical protein